MKWITTIILLFIIAIHSQAQNYTRDAGIGGIDGISFSYRQFFDDDLAYEGILSMGENGIRVYGFKEFLMPTFIGQSENLFFTYGFGVHGGVSYQKYFQILNRKYYISQEWSPVFGIDGMAVFEYYAPEVPLVFSLGAKPGFEFSMNRFFKLEILDIMFLVKYRF